MEREDVKVIEVQREVVRVKDTEGEREREIEIQKGVGLNKTYTDPSLVPLSPLWCPTWQVWGVTVVTQCDALREEWARTKELWSMSAGCVLAPETQMKRSDGRQPDTEPGRRGGQGR